MFARNIGEGIETVDLTGQRREISTSGASIRKVLRPPFRFLLVMLAGAFATAIGHASGPVDAVSPRMSTLAAEMKGKNPTKAVADFWAEIGRTGTPLIEPADTPDEMLVTFIARGPADGGGSNASLMTFRTTEPLAKLIQVPGTDVWARSWKLSRKARAIHLFAWPQGRGPAPDAVNPVPTREHGLQESFTDPFSRLNSIGSIALGRMGPARKISWFEGDQAPAERYLANRAGVAKGRLTERRIESPALGGPRMVTIYTPAHVAADGPVLILFDAEQYLTVMATPTILDNMIADKAIAPVTVAFVHAGDSRNADLPPNPKYQSFLRDELLPLLRRDHRVSRDPAKVALGGFSYGGLAAAAAALRDPDIYGNVISQSGGFWWSANLRPPLDPRNPMPLEANGIASDLANTAPPSGRRPHFYMDVGTWEGLWQIGSNRQLRDLLKARGHVVTYAEFEGAHDYIAWRATLPDALIATFGAGRP